MSVEAPRFKGTQTQAVSGTTRFAAVMRKAIGAAAPAPSELIGTEV